jgi:CubicO group peptidase (beta-lactamase class C family)
MFDTETGNYWHNGATGGYSAYAFFNPKQDYAAVVLLNTTVGPNGSFADRLGQHISQRLAGKPAISLGN